MIQKSRCYLDRSTESYTTIGSRELRLLLPPHLEKQRQVLIPWSLSVKSIQSVSEEILHVRVLPLPQEILHGRDKLSVDVARERMAGIIDEDANQHDRIVLRIGRWRCAGVREHSANAMGGFPGGIGTGLGAFDDTRQMDEFSTLL